MFINPSIDPTCDTGVNYAIDGARRQKIGYWGLEVTWTLTLYFCTIWINMICLKIVHRSGRRSIAAANRNNFAGRGVEELNRWNNHLALKLGTLAACVQIWSTDAPRCLANFTNKRMESSSDLRLQLRTPSGFANFRTFTRCVWLRLTSDSCGTSQSTRSCYQLEWAWQAKNWGTGVNSPM